MKKKIKKLTKEYYDWNTIVDLVEEKAGKSTRDWADKWGEGHWSATRWAEKHGYDLECLKIPDKTKPSEDWPKDSPQMINRIKINTLYRTAEDGEKAERPYQDFWHYALDNIFYDISNGCIRWFNPYDALEDVEDSNDEEESNEWVREILRLFIEVFKENNIPNEIEVEISW